MGVDPNASAPSPAGARIRLLPDDLVDQIAAGEVVERPASVVKELVENALDAGARRVRVELREGGNALIAVADDGHGMSPEEARLALQRHATSKIAALADLDRIGSFGFRGEALPAIASVSRLRLVTRPEGADAGHEIRVEGGAIRLERAAGCPQGTRIEVADLFGAVPARRKFLKKPGTEWGHAIDWLGRLAVALPGVHFEVVRDDREAAVWPATGDARERIERVLGRGQAADLIDVEWEEAAGHVAAWVSPPDRTRASATGVHLYVNGRPVRDRLLRHAVLDAYRDWLPRGRYPTAVVFVTVDPARVDVNVHPAKWEVRFAEPQAIHRLVRHALREAMAGRTHLGAAAPPRPGHAGGPGGSAHRARRDAADAARGASAGPEHTDWIFADRGAAGQGDGAIDPGHGTARDTPREDVDAAPDRAGPLVAQPGREAAGAARLRFADLRLIGQMLASYLVLEGEDGMILIDQHAAHERILYERLRAGWLAAGVERQGLLVPVQADLSAAAVEALEEASATVEQLGFEVERFGDTAVVIRAIPALLSGHDPAGLVRDLADEVSRGEGAGGTGAARTRWLAAADRIFATLACHSARRFGDLLPAEEQRAILEGLDTIPWAPTCPHGRPVATRLTRAEIERRFSRH
jgi:DNA mismatch repair protein MutL